MIVIPGTASQVLAKEVADELNAELAGITCKVFPDGELYLRIEGEVANEECVVVQSTPRPQNRNIFELLALLETLREGGAAKITAVVPYLAYARQDRSFTQGEAVTSRVLAKHISLNADEFVGINLHESTILDYFTIEAGEIDASPELGEYFRSMKLDDCVVIGPDRGALPMAERVAGRLGCEYDHLEKTRLGPGEVVVKPKNLNIQGRNALIVDDIIDSGGSMVEAIKMLKAQGAADIYVACVHPVATGSAISRLFAAGAREVVGTNTIPSQISFISVAPLIAGALE
ncbi:ribose-phosphate diphosphokinase [Candidatus Pyrohabitans sp.]